MTSPQTPRFPSVGAAIVVWGLVLLATFLVGYLFNIFEWNQDWLLLASPAVVLTLTWAATLVLGLDIRETLSLRLPSAADLFMAFPLAISFVVLSDQISSLTQEFFPLSEDLLEGFADLVRAEGWQQWTIKLLGIGIGAAVSEELLFRGFIQNALLQKARNRRSAILWTAFLFTILHILPLPTYLIAGLVLGVAALASGSILVPILIHCINNLAALAMLNLADMESLADPVWIPAEILLPALAIFVLTMGFYIRRLLPIQETDEDDVRRAEPSLFERENDLHRSATLDRSAMSLEDEMAGVPAPRRRLGWAVVGCATLIGSFVLLGLFLTSIYFASPRERHATMIDFLRTETARQLTPESADRASELDEAFDRLNEANEGGGVRFTDIWSILLVYANASNDGALDRDDVDDLMEAIGAVVNSNTRPQRL